MADSLGEYASEINDDVAQRPLPPCGVGGELAILNELLADHPMPPDVDPSLANVTTRIIITQHQAMREPAIWDNDWAPPAPPLPSSSSSSGPSSSAVISWTPSIATTTRTSPTYGPTEPDLDAFEGPASSAISSAWPVIGPGSDLSAALKGNKYYHRNGSGVAGMSGGRKARTLGRLHQEGPTRCRCLARDGRRGLCCGEYKSTIVPNELLLMIHARVDRTSLPGDMLSSMPDQTCKSCFDSQTAPWYWCIGKNSSRIAPILRKVWPRHPVVMSSTCFREPHATVSAHVVTNKAYVAVLISSLLPPYPGRLIQLGTAMTEERSRYAPILAPPPLRG